MLVLFVVLVVVGVVVLRTGGAGGKGGAAAARGQVGVVVVGFVVFVIVVSLCGSSAPLHESYVATNTNILSAHKSSQHICVSRKLPEGQVPGGTAPVRAPGC